MRAIVSVLLAATLVLAGGCTASKTASGPVSIDVTIAKGKVTPSAATYEVSVGSTVTITVNSDAADTIHVHGYDIEQGIVAGTPTIIFFTADKTGTYEVETHTVAATVARLHVR